jgi:hypothetical protein
MNLTDAEWELWKTAVTEYSMYRPYLQYEAFVPVPASIEQVPPDGTFGIESIAYGVPFSLAEVMPQPEGEQGWCFYSGVLYLTPAPTDATAINIVWRIAHQPDELTRTFPTIPATDMHVVEWLVAAVTAEAEASPVELGLAGYTIGGTTIKWSQQGGSSGPSVATRAERYRSRALAALGEPMIEWG